MTVMRFTCQRYPHLKVGLTGAKERYAAFEDGVLDTTDPAAIKALKALGEEYGVTAEPEPKRTKAKE